MAMAYSGPDISYAQGAYTPPAWAQFVIINASRANVGFAVGSYYHYQVDRARQAGKEVGHYFFNGNIDATQCADFFVNNLYDFRSGDMLWLDVEAEPSSGTAAWNPAQALAFGKRVKARTGIMPGIYLNKSLENGYDWSACVAAGMRLWSAYYANGALPAVRNWPEVSMIQWTSTPIDTNKAAYTQAEMAGSAPAPKIKEDIMAKLIRNKTTGEVRAVNIDTGLDWYVPTPDYLTLVQGWKFFDDAPVQDMDDNVYTLYRQIAATNKTTTASVDSDALAAAITTSLTPIIQASLSQGAGPTAEQITTAVQAAMSGIKVQIDAGDFSNTILNAASQRLAS